MSFFFYFKLTLHKFTKMFRLLSKESNIFSIPVYIVFLLLMIFVFNSLSINSLNLFSLILTFVGISLGYFIFNRIKLNAPTHLPYFLYTLFIFGFYTADLDIGIAVALLTNSFLLLFLTSTDEEVRKDYYLLIGSLLLINYIFLPTTWPMTIFVILHILFTSKRIALDLFKVFFGALLVLLAYFSVMYFLNFNSWDSNYFPFGRFTLTKEFFPLYLLAPLALMVLLAVLDHFKNFNKKSPDSRFKYSFILIFSLAQLTTLILYMAENTEYLLFLALPLSIILARYMRFLPKYWMREVGVWLVILTVFVFKIGTYFDFFT